MQQFFNTLPIFQIILQSAILGFILGAFFEVFRLLRCAGINNNFFVFIQDLTFMLISGVCIFLFTFAVSYGVFRAHIFIGVIAGFLLYYFTLGKLIFALSHSIIALIRKILKLLYKNTVILAYNTIDKSYKKGKIIIESWNDNRFNSSVFKNASTGFLKYQERKIARETHRRKHQTKKK